MAAIRARPPACRSDPEATVTFDRPLLRAMLAPALSFQRAHAVPLWVDQLMCAAAATPGADQWLADSIAEANFSVRASMLCCAVRVCAVLCDVWPRGAAQLVELASASASQGTGKPANRT